MAFILATLMDVLFCIGLIIFDTGVTGYKEMRIAITNIGAVKF